MRTDTSNSRLRTSRRGFLKSAGAGVVAAGAGNAFAQAARAQGKRNVLLYVVDDQGSDDAGCYGNPVIRTPGLDLLASEGTRFTNGFCTSASCSASRSVILSGLHNHANGQYGHQHSYHHFSAFPKVRSLPVLMGEAGYRTACVGKYHVAPNDVFKFQTMMKRKDPPKMAEDSRAFIADSDDRPFFLYFCTTEPHRNFNRKGSDPVDPDDVIVPPYLPDIPECREELAQYYGSVQLADKGLLDLIGILKETGHWDDTLIIYVSDNGIAFPGAKTNLYDPGMRLPCVVRDPYQDKSGTVCNAMVSWADITPTILDFADATPKDAAFHGRSFLPVLDEPDPEGWDEVYASHTFHEITMYYPMRVVRTRRHKLIWNIAYGLEYPFASDLWASATWQGVLERGMKDYASRPVDAYLHRDEFELYDLQKDPLEVRNLADDPAHADLLDRMKQRLRAFQKRTKDPWEVKWEHE
ncbi:MAG: sulfatase [bacterium]|nr:sulfatase [bacterium]